jgi:hypothetical protein
MNAAELLERMTAFANSGGDWRTMREDILAEHHQLERNRECRFRHTIPD